MFVGGVFRGSRVGVWTPRDPAARPACKIIIPGASASTRRRGLLRPGDRDVDAPARRAWRAEQGLPPHDPDRDFDPAAPVGGLPAVLAGHTHAGDPFVHGDALLALHTWQHRITTLPPGPALVAALAQRPDDLVDPIPARRSQRPFVPDGSVADATLDEITARARQIAALHAEQAHALTRLAEHYPADPACLPLELAQALHVDEATAAAHLARADHLVNRLPATLHAWSTATIADHAVDAILNATANTSPAVAAAVETHVLPKAGHRTYDQTYRAACRRVNKLDGPGVKERRERAAQTRRITRRNLGDDMGRLSITATAAAVATIWEALTGLADAAHTANDHRDLGQRRVDALTDLCADILANGRYHTTRLPDRQGHHPQIRVTMPIDALLGGTTTCDLDGHGPISADHARTIAADADLHRLLHDPVDGRLLHYGRTRYRPPKELRDHVITRDHTCAVPGCPQSAIRSDLDHTINADPDPTTGQPTNGPTDPENLGPFCRFHHNLKTRGLLTATRHADGSFTITTPLGRTTTREPHAYDPDKTDTSPPRYPPQRPPPNGKPPDDDPAPF